MAERTYPSYWLYKDAAGEWRWTYEARNGETIAKSSERGIEIMQASAGHETWLPASLANAT